MAMTGLKKINRLFQKTFAFIYLLSTIDFKLIFQNYKKESHNVLWIKLNIFNNIYNYLSNNDLLDDIILLNYLANKGNYRIVFSSSVGNVWNSNIYFSITKTENSFKFYNYSKWLNSFLNHLVIQNNKTIPNQNVVDFWENKIYMHEKFDEFSIPTPLTQVLKFPLVFDHMKIKNDFLLKLPHSSGSKGIYHFKNFQEYLNYNFIGIIPNGSDIIVQERVNMTFDLRVVINDYKVISHYWRRNKKNEPWRPTATSHGSIIDYEPLNINIKLKIETFVRLLNLPYCAFDVLFRDDNLNDLLVLEVSSSYQLNPVNLTGLPYREYKKRIFKKNPYWKSYIQITSDEIIKIIKYYE